jgi:hypothetical protein
MTSAGRTLVLAAIDEALAAGSVGALGSGSTSLLACGVCFGFESERPNKK